MFKSLNFSFVFLLLGLVFAAAPATDFAQDSGKAVSAAPTPPQLSPLSKLPPDQRYTPADKSFKVWMPAEPTSVSTSPTDDAKKKPTATQYKWEASEGIFAVTQFIFGSRNFDDDKDLADFLSDTNQKMLTSLPQSKLTSTKKASLGKWRGTEYSYQSGPSILAVARVLASENTAYILTIFYLNITPDAEKQLFKALDSFEIVALDPSFNILPVSDGFVSKEYNFSIGLPKTPATSGGEIPDASSVPHTGWGYSWTFAEGTVTVSQGTYPPESAKKVLYLDNFCGKAKDTILKQPLFKMVSETAIKAGETPGCEMVVDVGGGQATAIFRYYVTKTQEFTIVGSNYKPNPDTEKVLRKALDTFTILKN